MTNEYDKAQSEKAKPKQTKKKVQKKKKKEESEVYSDDSGIRLGHRDQTIDADMEEEELLKRELNMGSPSRDDE